VVCVSDTHNRTPPIPHGEILIHAGDLSDNGILSEIQAQIDWLASLPHAHKVVIAGNHDSWLDPEIRAKLSHEEREGSLDWKGVQYAQSESLVLEVAADDPKSGSPSKRKLNVYAVPHVPYCGSSTFAFQYRRHLSPWKNTCRIPADTDILVTHTPPRFHRDVASSGSKSLGCKDLLEEIWRVRPKLHIFGHVHASRGMSVVRWDYGQRAYERACRREVGGMLEVFNLLYWLDLCIVTLCGIWGFLSDLLGRDTGRETVMVNAAVWTDSCGHLEHPIQVVEL
jgi:predicted phosphohydrolase